MGAKGGVHTKKTPMRQCTGCRERKEKNSLVRIIYTPERQILLDKTGKKNGRGAYIKKDLDVLAKAKKNKTFQQLFIIYIIRGKYDR